VSQLTNPWWIGLGCKIYDLKKGESNGCAGLFLAQPVVSQPYLQRVQPSCLVDKIEFGIFTKLLVISQRCQVIVVSCDSVNVTCE